MQSKLLLGMFVMVCPACGVGSEDTLEVMGMDTVHHVRCEGCSGDYFVAIKECLSCGAETVFTSGEEPAATVLDALMCAQCARPFVPAGEDADDARRAN